jgi:hypothetical protein
MVGKKREGNGRGCDGLSVVERMVKIVEAEGGVEATLRGGGSEL